MELQNSDIVERGRHGRNYERLVTRFEVGKASSCRPASTRSTQVRGTYTLGQQRAVSGVITVGAGGFYDGTLTELTWRGRVEFSSQFYVEPTLSWNRVDVPWRLDNTNLVSTRVTYTLHAAHVRLGAASSISRAPTASPPTPASAGSISRAASSSSSTATAARR